MQIFILCRYRKIIDKHYGERCKWDKKISFIVMFFHVILKQNTFAKPELQLLAPYAPYLRNG